MVDRLTLVEFKTANRLKTTNLTVIVNRLKIKPVIYNRLKIIID